ncbi:MAG: hypothetical protein B7Y25_07955 [Alphaproteobacteria bacterium 16-39-46]|nr:MAG: hypothetical protein B7Y25_07955 [Alphaproteobacteria bacterium 16-39-46]OZA41354.1 MAG: hypothetical protein B7X84_08120 [Alphaproteobacteria bacterium 17-39-52]HQS84855.1 Bax inhibitor-1/YccA family protein [Alphaproteobacteria bacterium]HQS94606.1 Bax inhibitor-1/YccA family protein [Alphaproteobacteria bacterium]
MASNFNRNVSGRAASSEMTYDMGLRAYMLKVYNFMGLGLGLTGLVSFIVSQTPSLIEALYANSMLALVFLFLPFGLVLYLQFKIKDMSFQKAQAMFWLYAALMGLALTPIFLVYTGTSIARVFFITAGTFGSMSLYGYTTQRDLSAWGSFLFMGLIGIIIGGLVNIFLQSSAFQFALSIIGVLIFTGLTAYDTQTIKEIYASSDSQEIAGKKAIMGALTLYLDFINLFLMLLRLFGDRR